MKFLSVCSGIESAGHAWKKLGWECVGVSEIEPFACAALHERLPATENFGDMENFAQWPELEFDVLVGGTPCQAFSVAGLRESMSDERGNLAAAFCRLADRFDPALIVWENVPGVFSTADNAFGCFLGALCGEDAPLIPLGEGWTNAGVVAGPRRTIAWRVIDAQGFVAQRRRRVFVVAARAGAGVHPADVLFETETDAVRLFGARLYTGPIFPLASRLPGNSGESEAAGQSVAGPISNRSERGGFRTTDLDTHGAYVTSNAEGSRNLTLTSSNLQRRVTNHSPLIHGNYVPDTLPQAMTAKWAKYSSGPAGDEFANLITQDVADPLVARESKTWSHEGKNNFRMRNVVDAIGWTEELTAGTEIAGAVQYGGEGGRHEGVMTPQRQVRRLTPRECERLMALPDDYTLIAYRGKDAPDNPRYKALGNSMVSSVMWWIGKRIDTAWKRGSGN